MNTPLYLITRLVTANADASYAPGELILFPDEYAPRLQSAAGESVWAEDLRRIEYCIVIVDLEQMRAMVQPFFHDLTKEVRIDDGEFRYTGKRGATSRQMKTMELNHLFERDDLEGDGWQFIN